jgi:chromosome segregation ATPase
MSLDLGILFAQQATRPGWYDWPWGAVGAMAIMVGLIVWLLRSLLRDYFASPGQLKEMRDTLVAERTELRAALEHDIEALGHELRQYEQRCDGRTTKFEERLEKGFATITMVNGVGERVTAVDKKIDGTVTLFTQTRERADEAYAISRDLRKDLEHFMGRMEEKLGPVAEFQKELRTMNTQLGNLTSLLATLQASLPPQTPR